MSSNYFRLTLDAKSKKGSGYEFEGKAHLIFEMGAKNQLTLIHNTLELNDNQVIIGAKNYLNNFQSEHYMSSSKLKSLKRYRLSTFDKNEIEGGNLKGRQNKGLTQFDGDINYLNNLILDSKSTVKDVASFIIGSNAPGGLSDPNSDPVKVIFNTKQKYQITNFYNCEIDWDKSKEWNLFSLISAIGDGDKKNNASTFESFEQINNYKEIDIGAILNSGNLKVFPYGASLFPEEGIIFNMAFMNQNIDKFLNVDKNNLIDISTLSKDNFSKIDPMHYIIKNYIDKKAINISNNNLRRFWLKSIERNIKKISNNGDFHKGFIKGKEKAHIIENRFVKNALQNSNFDKDTKIQIVKLLLDEENYILLDRDTHNAWDNGEIFINEKGEIFPTEKGKDDIKRLENILNPDNAFYNNFAALSKNRAYLISQRNIFKEKYLQS